MSATDTVALPGVARQPEGGGAWRAWAPRLRAALPGAVFCLLVAGLWEVLARTKQSPLVPDLAEVWGEILRLLAGGMALEQVGITLWRISLGGIAGFAIAVLLGLFAARSRLFGAFIRPAVLLGLTVPGLVWALLCVIWFGVGLATPVVSIILGIAPPLLVTISQGLRAVDSELTEMAHVFRFSRAARIRHVLLPSIVPFLLSGVRLAFSLAWKVIVLVELFGLSDGVGYQLNSEFSSQNVAGVLAWTLIFWVVMAAIEFGLMQGMENRLTRWRRESSL
ncbi:ABC transporter permease [Roseococcus pinisoli]|uniref:ABC transporter permease n=1 Tax=Roseococcus pinisoli TaxID=2835040 RepID=A0ABS5QJ03_9PROT|nr:ABC transporter permease [Roseococcus pinisoli]MBS7813664.1 ABC transporter permease [Roseococcus pinisoli]